MTPEQSLLRADHIYRVERPGFRALIQTNAHLRQLATGLQWAEGPCWFADQRLLLVSDIPAERILRLTMDGQVGVFCAASDFANGNTRDGQGRLVTCRHGTRSVTRTEYDGTVTTLADRHEGRRLNAPNDVVVARDGGIWFTDPTYGILTDYEGFRSDPEQPCRGVYRIDPGSGAVRLMIADFTQPNGLGFSPDESVLYVAESGRSHDDAVPAVIRAYDMRDGAPVNGRDHAEIDTGIPDGFRVDALGNIWCSAGDGVHCFDPAGQRLGRILVPEIVANLCFGGPRWNRMFIAATTSVYVVAINAPLR